MAIIGKGKSAIDLVLDQLGKESVFDVYELAHALALDIRDVEDALSELENQGHCFEWVEVAVWRFSRKDDCLAG